MSRSSGALIPFLTFGLGSCLFHVAFTLFLLDGIVEGWQWSLLQISWLVELVPLDFRLDPCVAVSSPPSDLLLVATQGLGRSEKTGVSPLDCRDQGVK